MLSDEERLGAMYDSRMGKIEQLQDQVQELKAQLAEMNLLAKEGYALVALASHTVDDRYSKWHEAAERFLREYVEATSSQGHR